MEQEEQQTCPTPPVQPNALVTKSDLYDLDVRLGERFTTIQVSLNGLNDRMTTHEAMHNQVQREESIEQEVRLDSKKVKVAVWAAGAAGIVTVTVAILQHVIVSWWWF